MFVPYLVTFLISMVPIIELRGAIPVAYLAYDIPIWWAFALSVVGNFLPVPFILLFIRRILTWMKGTKRLAKIALWLENKAQKKSDKVMKGVAGGLILFVGIPLPGTGAWTGALIASLFDMRMKYALPAIFLGVVIAGVLVSLASMGLLGIFNSIFVS